MGIREFLARRLEAKRRFKEVQEERRIQKTVEDREKTADERELESYHRENHLKRVKKILEFHRKQKQNEFWHGFKPLKDNPNYFNDNPILKQKNVFTEKGNIFKHKNTFKRQ